MRIVISGEGQIAYQLALALHHSHDLVVIEDDPSEAERFDRLDAQLLHGDATNPDTLREAGVERADSFISCRASDEINIISCLTAKRLGCRHATCFVSKGDYVHSFAGIVDEPLGRPGTGDPSGRWEPTPSSRRWRRSSCSSTCGSAASR